jgi:hypothetical protein
MSKWRSEWFDWQPARDSFVGSEGSLPGESPIIQARETVEMEIEGPSTGRTIERASGTMPAKPTKPAAEKIPPMPHGVSLVRWEPKAAPVLLTHMAIVTDVGQFIRTTLAELDAVLHSQQGSTPHRGVRELVDRLEQCGVVVRVRPCV